MRDAVPIIPHRRLLASTLHQSENPDFQKIASQSDERTQPRGSCALVKHTKPFVSHSHLSPARTLTPFLTTPLHPSRACAAAVAREQCGANARLPPSPLLIPLVCEQTIWHYRDRTGLPRGPCTIRTLRKCYINGVIDEHTLVWGNGLGHWVPMRNVRGMGHALSVGPAHSLRHCFLNLHPDTPRPPPLPCVAAVQDAVRCLSG